MKSSIIPAGDRVCAENAACSQRRGPVQAAPQDPAVLHQALLPPGPGQRPPACVCSSRLASLTLLLLRHSWKGCPGRRLQEGGKLRPSCSRRSSVRGKEAAARVPSD